MTRLTSVAARGAGPGRAGDPEVASYLTTLYDVSIVCSNGGVWDVLNADIIHLPFLV